MARAGVSPARESDELAEEEPPHKKRKGLVGTTLSLALDGAIFGSSVAYSAYQLWKNPPCVFLQTPNWLVTDFSTPVEPSEMILTRTWPATAPSQVFRTRLSSMLRHPTPRM